MSGFQLHPEAYNDLDEIWEYIVADSLDAADRVREEIYTAIRSIVSLRIGDIAGQASRGGRFDLSLFAIS